jgi:hypothetical protein
LKTWIYRITVNEAHNARRWFFRHRRREVDGTIAKEVRISATPFPIGDARSRLRAQRRKRVLIEDALARINPIFRAAVVLRAWNLPRRDRRCFGSSLGTVKSRITRGARAMRCQLEGRLEPQAAFREPAQAIGRDLGCQFTGNPYHATLTIGYPNRKTCGPAPGGLRRGATRHEQMVGFVSALPTTRWRWRTGDRAARPGFEGVARNRRRAVSRPDAIPRRRASVIDNLMRPGAAGCWGRATSALFIFGMLMPNLGSLRNATMTRPAVFTEASVIKVAAFAHLARATTIPSSRFKSTNRAAWSITMCCRANDR